MRLTIDEVSRLLHLPSSTVQRWIRQGKIPVFKSDDGYVFLEEDLRTWAKSRRIIIPSDSQKPRVQKSAQIGSLLSALKKGGTLYGISGNDVSGLLKAVIHAAPLDPSIDRNELLVRLIEREELATTGIGRGVAIPHPRSPLSTGPDEPSITTCFLDTPIDYGSIDGVAVFVLFLMLSPSPKTHLTVLARLSHLLRDGDFVDFLKKKPSEEDLLSRVEDMETAIQKTGRGSGPKHVF